MTNLTKSAIQLIQIPTRYNQIVVRCNNILTTTTLPVACGFNAKLSKFQLQILVAIKTAALTNSCLWVFCSNHCTIVPQVVLWKVKKISIFMNCQRRCTRIFSMLHLSCWVTCSFPYFWHWWKTLFSKFNGE